MDCSWSRLCVLEMMLSWSLTSTRVGSLTEKKGRRGPWRWRACYVACSHLEWYHSGALVLLVTRLGAFQCCKIGQWQEQSFSKAPLAFHLKRNKPKCGRFCQRCPQVKGSSKGPLKCVLWINYVWVSKNFYSKNHVVPFSINFLKYVTAALLQGSTCSPPLMQAELSDGLKAADEVTL